MQAIITKYHGSTDAHGSRISATATAGRLYVLYDHERNIEDNHTLAAVAFVRKFQWHKHNGFKGIIGGTLPSGDYAWILNESCSPQTKVK